MNKIEKLIQEKCPEGVEYKTLKESCNFKRGNSITRNDVSEGDIPVIAGGKHPAYYHSKFNRDGDTIAISSSGANAGFVSYWTRPVFLSDSFSISPKENICIIKYLFYYLVNCQNQIYATKKGSGVPHVHTSDLYNFKIPVPPLEVQKEIVYCLDKFTALEAELEAEQIARKRQFQYYREKLLSFDETVPRKTIESISIKITSGGTPLRSKNEYYNGTIPWLRTQEVDWGYIYDTALKITEEGLKNSSAKLIPANCVIVAMYGATAAKAAINKIPLCTNQACCNILVNGKVANYKYVFYWFCENYEKLRNMGEGSQSNLNAKKIRDFIIPVPPIAEQERIVAILDKFDKLVNDISVGLPAEIKARQQYEYYRNKLLTFKKK